MMSEVKQAAVIGSGTMGIGIAQLSIQNGFSTTLYDVDAKQIQQAKETLTKRLYRLVEKKKITQEDADKSLDRLKITKMLEDVSQSDIVIEAVPEKLEIKHSIFRQLEDLCSENTIFSTNTSSLSVTEISGTLKDPSRLAGLHFFNPAPLMPLVEIVRGMQTSEHVIETLKGFAESLGKTAVLCRDTPGFIVNRVARPFYNEALRITNDNIADVEQIDRILKSIGGFKMGPFELQDLIGIDINFATTQMVHNNFYGESRFRPNYYQERMVQAGRLGRKAGGGFYDYEPS